MSSVMKSPYRGVTWHKRTRRWLVKLTHEQKLVNFGRFDDPKEAARVWDVAAWLLRGPGTRMNFDYTHTGGKPEHPRWDEIKQVLFSHGFTILYG